MVFFKAEKMQRLAELVQRVQKAIEDEGGDPSRIERDLNEVARITGFDLEIARMADAATLESVLTVGGPGSESRCWSAAEALFLDGLLEIESGREAEGRDRLEKARRLYRIAGTGLDLPEAVAEPDRRLRRIEAILG